MLSQQNPDSLINFCQKFKNKKQHLMHPFALPSNYTLLSKVEKAFKKH